MVAALRGSQRSLRVSDVATSVETKIKLSAMHASAAEEETRSKPNEVRLKLRLCDSVNAVSASTKARMLRTLSTRANKKIKWSRPVAMWRVPSRAYWMAISRLELALGIVQVALSGVRIRDATPPAVTMRTTASV
jgi:hypothetical protein